MKAFKMESSLYKQGLKLHNSLQINAAGTVSLYIAILSMVLILFCTFVLGITFLTLAFSIIVFVFYIIIIRNLSYSLNKYLRVTKDNKLKIYSLFYSYSVCNESIFISQVEKDGVFIYLYLPLKEKKIFIEKVDKDVDIPEYLSVYNTQLKMLQKNL
jgi:small-conductance mechanosensitive channel